MGACIRISENNKIDAYFRAGLGKGIRWGPAGLESPVGARDRKE